MHNDGSKTNVATMSHNGPTVGVMVYTFIFVIFMKSNGGVAHVLSAYAAIGHGKDTVITVRS